MDVLIAAKWASIDEKLHFDSSGGDDHRPRADGMRVRAGSKPDAFVEDAHATSLHQRYGEAGGCRPFRRGRDQ